MAGPGGRARACLTALAWAAAALVLRDLAAVLLPPPYGELAFHPAPETLLYLGLSWAFLRAEGQPLSSLGLRLDGLFLRQFGRGAALGAGVILAAALVAAAAGVRWGAGDLGAGPLVSGLGLYLAVAAAEELNYRGYPFQRLVAGLGPWPAQVLVTAWFVFGHLGNPGMVGATRAWAVLDIGLASLLLGLAWLRTGSLAASLGIHFAWNFVQGTVLGFGVSGTHAPALLRPVLPGGREWLHGGAFGLEAGLPCAVAATLAILLLLRPVRAGAILGRPQEAPCPDAS